MGCCFGSMALIWTCCAKVLYDFLCQITKHNFSCISMNGEWRQYNNTYIGAFTLEVKLVFNENLGGILGGTQCYIA
jgi:hypothetical protein